MTLKIFFIGIGFLIFQSSFGQNQPIATPSNGEKNQKELKGESVFMEGMKAYMAEKYEPAIENFKTVTEKYDGGGGAYLMLAKAYEANSQIDLATLSSKEATLIDKENIDLQLYYADLLIKTKAYKVAENTYKDVIKKSNSNMDAYIGLTNVYLLQNEYADAIKTYDILEKNIGVSEEITRQKQLLYLKLNKVDEAVKEGGKLINAEPLEPEYVIQQAQLMLNNGKEKEAQKMLEEYLATQGNFAEGHVILAEIYRKQGDLKACNLELQAAFRNKALSVDTKLKILGSYMELLKTSNSTETLDDLIKLTQALIDQDPEEARGYVIMGDLLMKKGNVTEARNQYVKSTSFDKSVFDVWLAIIELDNKLGDVASLVKHATEAADYFPNQAFFWYNAGLGNYLVKDFDEAIYQLDEAKMLAFDNPELLKNIYTLQGDAYNELRKYTESSKAYEQALEIDPNYVSALNNYSYFLSLRKANLDKAERMATTLVGLIPNEPEYQDTYAWVLFQKENYAKAEEILSKAVEMKGAKGIVLEHHGDVLFKLGKKTQAVEQWKKALELGQNSPNLPQKISQELYIE